MSAGGVSIREHEKFRKGLALQVDPFDDIDHAAADAEGTLNLRSEREACHLLRILDELEIQEGRRIAS